MDFTDMNKLIIGLNPAWQQTLIFDSVKKGEVNRAIESRQFASGKGVNALRALACAGETATILQVVGGSTGDAIIDYVESTNSNHISIKTDNNTRICTTVIDKSDQTVSELIGKTEPLSLQNYQLLSDNISDLSDSFDAVLISGTCPNGVSETVYAKLLQKYEKLSITILDAHKNIKPVLEVSSPNILKINHDELLSLTNEESVESGTQKLLTNYEIELIIITNGAEPTLVFTKEEQLTFPLPHTEVINPIGAGDTCAAMLLKEFAKLRQTVPNFDGKLFPHLSSEKLSEIIPKALSAATASCKTLIPGQF